MAHEITTTDSMMSARNRTPWHGLGTVIEGNPTIADAIQLSGLTWRVECRPNWTSSGEGFVSTPSQSTIRVNADGSEVVLGSVGPTYEPLQNVDAFAWFQPWIDSGAAVIETAGSLQGGRRVWVCARIVGDPIDVGGGDEVEVHVVLAHAHDGTLAVRAMITPVRTVCANTLAAGIREAQAIVRVQHRGDMAARLEDAASTLAQVRAELAKRGDLWRAMAATQVASEAMAIDYLGAVYGQDQGDFAKGRRLAPLMDRFNGGAPGSDLATASGTVWGLLQAVTDYETHHALQARSLRGDAAKRAERAGRLADGLTYGDAARRLQRAEQLAAGWVARGAFSLESVFGEHAQIVTDATAAHPDALVLPAAAVRLA